MVNGSVRFLVWSCSRSIKTNPLHQLRCRHTIFLVEFDIDNYEISNSYLIPQLCDIRLDPPSVVICSFDFNNHPNGLFKSCSIPDDVLFEHLFCVLSSFFSIIIFNVTVLVFEFGRYVLFDSSDLGLFVLVHFSHLVYSTIDSTVKSHDCQQHRNILDLKLGIHFAKRYIGKPHNVCDSHTKLPCSQYYPLQQHLLACVEGEGNTLVQRVKCFVGRLLFRGNL